MKRVLVKILPIIAALLLLCVASSTFAMTTGFETAEMPTDERQ